MLDRDLAVKLFPNLPERPPADRSDSGPAAAAVAVAVAVAGEPDLLDDDEDEDDDWTADDGAGGPSEAAGAGVELPNRRLPANSCLLDLRVVELVAGRLVLVVEVDGVGVVLVEAAFDALDAALAALSELIRVWNLLFRLPNFLLAEAAAAAESACEPDSAAGLVASLVVAVDGPAVLVLAAAESASVVLAGVVAVCDDDEDDGEGEAWLAVLEVTVGGLTEVVT